MTDINAVNTSLDGQTGTSNFLGTNDPVSTGDCDLSLLVPFRIPNSDAPVLDATGEIAIDNLVAGYPGMLKFNAGTTEVSAIPMDIVDFSLISDGQAIGYVSASSKFAGKALTGFGMTEPVRQVLHFAGSSDTTVVNGGTPAVLTGGITPKATDSVIDIICYGQYELFDNGSLTNYARIINFRLVRNSPSGQTLSQPLDGCDVRISTTDALPVTRPVTTRYTDTISDVSTRQYEYQLRLTKNGNTATFFGLTYTAHMILIERKP